MYDGFGYLGLDTSEEVRQQLIDEEEAEEKAIEDYHELKDGIEDYNDISEDGFVNYSEGCWTDEISGHHDSGMGWAPDGQWCGECCKSSCKDCPVWEAIKVEIERDLSERE